MEKLGETTSKKCLEIGKIFPSEVSATGEKQGVRSPPVRSISSNIYTIYYIYTNIIQTIPMPGRPKDRLGQVMMMLMLLMMTMVLVVVVMMNYTKIIGKSDPQLG